MEVLSTTSSLENVMRQSPRLSRDIVHIDPACHSPFPMVHFVIRSGVVLTAADPNGRKWPRTLFIPEDTP